MENKTYHLFRSITSLKGVGIKTKQAFYKAGIYKIIDLLLHLPRKIEVKKVINSVTSYDFEEPKEIVIKLKITSHTIGQTKGRQKAPYKILCLDENQKEVTLFFINYFSKEYIKKNYPIDSNIYVCGKVSIFKGKYTISHPYLLGNCFKEQELVERIYPSINGVSSKVLSKLINQALANFSSIKLNEWHNRDFLKQNSLPSFTESINVLHNTKNQEDIDKEESNFVKRLAADEMLSYNINLLKNTVKYKKQLGISFESNNKTLITKLFKNLPFTLSDEQIKAIKEIFTHMDLKWQTNQLLQGDVGSGKTIVCFFCALKAIQKGYQVALIAPTTVLAKQHYQNASKMLENIGVKCALLTSQNTKKEKSQIIEKAKKGEIDILIGTHSLIEDDIELAKLGLVIIDEQHKFGVTQRYNLVKKGLKPDIISMSATPIPRTLALSIKNIINITTINSKPKNRKETKTSALNVENIEKIYTKFNEKLKNNTKVFWVCPLVDESEKLDLVAAKERYKLLKEKLPDFEENIYLIHGKMKEKEKEEILQSFKKVKKGVLVSTTVIEVGIDIPDTNIVVIEEANRFGLSQLHQLRGRVGRGSEQGYCILLYKSKIGKNARARIKALKENESGFNLANIDFMLRGYGDILGTKQTGLINFKIADLEKDMRLFETLIQEAGIISTKKVDAKQVEAVSILLQIFDKKENSNT